MFLGTNHCCNAHCVTVYRISRTALVCVGGARHLRHTRSWGTDWALIESQSNVGPGYLSLKGEAWPRFGAQEVGERRVSVCPAAAAASTHHLQHRSHRAFRVATVVIVTGGCGGSRTTPPPKPIAGVKSSALTDTCSYSGSPSSHTKTWLALFGVPRWFELCSSVACTLCAT